jgi:site-specific recombinase
MLPLQRPQPGSASREAEVPLEPVPRIAADARRRTEAFARAWDLTGRLSAFADLMQWIWAARSDRIFSVRLERWIRLLEDDELLRVRVQRSFATMLAGMRSVSLFAEAGLPSRQALFQEGLRRVLQRMVPSVRSEDDTARLLLSVFSSPIEVERLVELPQSEFDRIAVLLWRPPQGNDVAQRLRNDLVQALRLLAMRIGARALSPAMRERGSGRPTKDVPFYCLPFATETMLHSLDLAEPDAPAVASPDTPVPDSSESARAWNELIRDCALELDQVHLHMERAGVSSDLVFDLKTVDLALGRMRALVEVLTARGEPATLSAVRQLLSLLAVAQLQDTRLSSLLRQNMNLLARKTVERTGHGGEHYIAHSQRDYWLMWRAALGGGLLTVLTAAIKMRISGADFAPFVEGLLIGTNYAVSFVLLQVFGLVLATKQPSMTAATFAGIVRRNRGFARWSKIADFVAAITRSQLAAALGNVFAVVIGSFALERLWQRVFRTSYLPVASAQHVYQTLHPFTSGTAFFAIITGVILWLAALIGGWFENFAVFHRLTDAIRQHPFGNRFGEATLNRVADILERDLSGWSTSIALGYLLGFTPVVAAFFGLHIDVRHVTLTTGTLALAAARYGTWWFGRGWLYWAIAGIGVTFVLNLVTSFSIAAYVALRAYDVPRREQRQLLFFIAREAIRSPLKFLLPIGERGTAVGEETASLVEGHD